MVNEDVEVSVESVDLKLKTQKARDEVKAAMIARRDVLNAESPQPTDKIAICSEIIDKLNAAPSDG